MTEAVNLVCKAHPDRYECPDALIDYSPRFDEYGIIVHNGGQSYVEINYCPWCGAELPRSRRVQWFEELDKRGIHDPTDDQLPPEFRDDRWYRNRRSDS